MKKLLLAWITCITMNSFAQQKLDNEIIIKERINYDSIKSLLTSKNFALVNSDTNIISTYPRLMLYCPVWIKLTIQRKDTFTVISAVYREDVSMGYGSIDYKKTFLKVEYYKNENLDIRKAWDLMAHIVQQLSNKLPYFNTSN